MEYLAVKTCTKCDTDKAVSLFSKDARAKAGFRTQCKACVKEYQVTNAGAIAAYKKDYYEKNAVRVKAYRAKNAEAIAATKKMYISKNAVAISAYGKEYKKANRGVCNASEAKRRAAKLERTPVWSDSKEISLIYQQSASLQKLFGRAMNVDHVVPLQGDLVSGLHAPHNLQIMFAPDNLYKSNKFDIEGFNA